MFYFGYFDEDKCFYINGTFYCDVKVTAGAKTKKHFSAIATNAICFGYAGGLMRDDARYLKNLKFLEFHETHIPHDGFFTPDESDIKLTAYLRVDMDEVAKEFKITWI